MPQLGKYIILAGAVIMLLGAIVYFFGNKLGWFGNLPGDIKIEKENVKIYFPLATMILISIVISLLFWIFRKFF